MEGDCWSVSLCEDVNSLAAFYRIKGEFKLRRSGELQLVVIQAVRARRPNWAALQLLNDEGRRRSISACALSEVGRVRSGGGVRTIRCSVSTLFWQIGKIDVHEPEV